MIARFCYGTAFSHGLAPKETFRLGGSVRRDRRQANICNRTSAWINLLIIGFSKGVPKFLNFALPSSPREGGRPSPHHKPRCILRDRLRKPILSAMAQARRST
jgi:hypothetical protein